jgi:ABC-2 type transport system ATP-binding protein
MCARPAGGNIAGMTEVRELTRQPPRNVFVRSPRRGGLTRVLTSMGATVLAEPGHGLSVTGMDACTIASAAAAHYIPIQELTPRSASPENTDLQTSPAR